MAYDEKLANRVRKALAGQPGLTEKKMFGGVAFLLHGRMCCGVLQDDLVVRVGSVHYAAALSRPHVRPMDFTGRPLTGFIYVEARGVKTATALAKWVREAAEYAVTLPAAKTRPTKRTQHVRS